MKLVKLSNIVGRIESEQRYWQGYDPCLLEELSKETKNLERELHNLEYDADCNRTEVKKAFIIGFAVTFAIAALVVPLSWMGWKMHDATKSAKKEIKKEMLADPVQLESLFGSPQILVIPDGTSVRKFKLYMVEMK
jgi:hypothetical protein